MIPLRQLHRTLLAIAVGAALLAGCSLEGPTGASTQNDPAAQAAAAVDASIRGAADLGPGLWPGATSGSVTVREAAGHTTTGYETAGRRAAAGRVLLLTFDDYSEDGRIVLDGTVDYVENAAGEAAIEGDLRVRLRITLGEPVEDPVAQLGDRLRLTVQVERGAEESRDPGPSAPAWRDGCFAFDAWPADADAAEAARGHVVRQLITAAERGPGSHAGDASGRLSQRLSRQIQEHDDGAVQVIDWLMQFDQYADGALVYDGRFAGRAYRSREGTRYRFAGDLAISGRIEGSVSLCDRLGRALLTAALTSRSDDVAAEGRAANDSPVDGVVEEGEDGP
jgi:hypothetical protein